MRARNAPSGASLPQKVAGFELVSDWKGPKKWPGHNWVVRCVSCKESRIVNTGMWNAVYKGTQTMKCDCHKVSHAEGRKATVRLTYNNESATIAEWSAKTGISPGSMYTRLTRRDARGTAFPDEWVIFGTDKDNPTRKEPRQDIDDDIKKAIKAIEDEVIAVLRPAFIDAVNRAIYEKVRPILVGMKNRGELVTVTAPTPAIPDGHKITKDGLSHYSTTPHINDSEMVSMDATYLQAREYFGDEAAEYEYWPLKEEATNPDTGWLILPDNIAKWKDEQTKLKRDEERRKDAERKLEDDKVHMDCLPGHEFALWRESMPRFRLSDQPTPEEMPKQEDTVPLSDDEVKYFLDTPWWQKRVKNPFNIYNFGPICRTQYERIKAFHVPPQKQYPKGCDMAVAFKKSYSFCDSHRNLNEYLDFFAISEWCEDGRRKMDIEGCMDALVDRFVRWSESDVPKVRMQADRLLDWFPALPAYIKEHSPEWIKAYVPQAVLREADMKFLDTDIVEPTELHPVT